MLYKQANNTYIELKSKIESRAHYILEHTQGQYYSTLPRLEMIKITKDWLKTKLAITQMHNIYDELISQPLFQNDNVWADEQQQQLQQ